ncbi:MAG: bifunctional 4-hydroxy-2-oxoglutarate aldolase/2-dehydro-3-deoxy-phosphogluconate aldolase [Spirochaetota bacterium]|nr:bifunctional 4-hydroxy-2-oxoglutarate aldolase/2-dehydro-3-deoxy-phosphogluconate aldolase [Spirochaetota bacterium]
MFEKYISVPIIPVAVVETEEEIRNIAECALEFLPALELTMRTEYAYKALEILAKHYPQLPRAAATVLTVEQAERIINLGTNIIISPGFQPCLLEHAKQKNYHYIPGAVSPAEIEQCLAYGHKYIKFFPASVFGGTKWLQAVAPVYSHMDVKFMPLGGIKLENVQEYLKESNVFACGGSWLCPRNVLEQKDWKELRRRFQEAHNLLKEIK